jgi:hypothetical protein
VSLLPFYSLKNNKVKFSFKTKKNLLAPMALVALIFAGNTNNIESLKDNSKQKFYLKSKKSCGSCGTYCILFLK